MKLFKSKWIKTLVIGGCLTFATTSGVLANSEEVRTKELVESEIGVTVSSDRGLAPDYHGYESETLMHKHREIDSYLFGDHNGDFSDFGFKVTNTGPHEGEIQIGILPFDEVYAEYLYEVLGKDGIKIVEGLEAVTFALPVDSMDQPVSSNDASNVLTSDLPTTRIAADGLAETAVAENIRTLALEDTAAAPNSQAMIITLTATSFALIGMVIFFVGRKNSAKTNM